VLITKYYSVDQIEKNKIKERYTQDLVGKPEGKGPPRRRWENDIKMDLQEVGCGDMDWIDVAQDRDM